jgi:hypothetical protein
VETRSFLPNQQSDSRDLACQGEPRQVRLHASGDAGLEKDRTDKILALVFIAFLLPGCGGSQKRKEGTDELKRIQISIHDLHISVAAGLTKQECSQRFGDVLLKVGDLDSSAKMTLPKFRKNDQAIVRDVYAHFVQSIEAYKNARDYFGKSFKGSECEEGCSFFPQSEYDALKTQFPSLMDLPAPGQFGYYRPEMLQALWKVAGEEDTAATGLIRHHSFPSVSIRTRCRNPTLKPLVAFHDDAAGDWRIQNHELFKAGYHPKA